MRSRLRTSAGAAVVAVAAGSCSPGDIPPGPEEPSKNLRLLATFAHRVERHGLAHSFRLITEAGPVDSGSAPGLAPLLHVHEAELEALRSRLGNPPAPGDLDTLDALRDRLFWFQVEADWAVAPAIEKIRQARVRHHLADGLERLEVLAETTRADERRVLWIDAARSARDIAPLLVDAIRARNRWGESHGASSFLDLARRRRGLDVATARRLRDELAKALAPSRSETLQDPWEGETSDPALMARLARNLDTGHALARATTVLAWAGFPADPARIGGLRIAGPGPGNGGFASAGSFAVEPPVDVRVVLRPAAGIFAHWAALHELGHAAQALLAPRSGIDLLRRTAAPAVAEGCGKVAERLVFERAWLEREGVDRSDIDALRSWERMSERWRARSILADTAFEEAIYADPLADLDALYIRIQADVAGVRVPPEGAGAWALERSLAFKPFNRFDYVLARCAQAAVYRRLRALPGGVLGDAAGRVVRDDVFGAAAGMRFEEWFRRAAGREASCDAWIEDVLR